MHHGPESHGVSNLSVKPDVLVGREKPGQLRTNDLDDVAQHGDKDKAAVESEDESGTAGSPYREFETVESDEFLVGVLAVFSTDYRRGSAKGNIPDCTSRMQKDQGGLSRTAH